MVFGLFKKKATKAPKVAKKAPRAAKKAPRIAKKAPQAELVGKVTHYFPKVRAAVIKVSKGPVAMGDRLYLKGYTTDFKQKVASMQVNHKPIKQAKKGQEIGLKVKSRVRAGDLVFKI